MLLILYLSLAVLDLNILFGHKNLIIHANTTSRQEKFGSGLDINIFLHNSSVSTCTFRKRYECAVRLVSF